MVKRKGGGSPRHKGKGKSVTQSDKMVMKKWPKTRKRLGKESE